MSVWDLLITVMIVVFLIFVGFTLGKIDSKDKYD